jgi:hypothetical protein
LVTVALTIVSRWSQEFNVSGWLNAGEILPRITCPVSESSNSNANGGRLRLTEPEPRYAVFIPERLKGKLATLPNVKLVDAREVLEALR